MESANFKKLCRLCLQESDFVTPMFGTVFKSDIPDKLAYCTGLKIKIGDGKPSLICQSCIDNLHISYAFKKTCLRSDRRFFSHFYRINLQEAQVNIEKVNDDVKPDKIEFEFPLIKEEVDEVAIVKIDDSDNDVNQDYDYNNFSYPENQNENKFKCTVDIDVEVEPFQDTSKEDDDFYWEDDEQLLSVLATAKKNEKKHSRKKELKPTKKSKQRVDKDGNPVKTKMQLHKEMSAMKRVKELENPPKVCSRRRNRHNPKNRCCECCDRVFPSQAERDKHVEDVHGGISTQVICEICGKVYRRDALSVHLRTHFPPQFCCKEPGCGYKAGNKGDLVKHKQVHGGAEIRKFSCKQCPQVYKSSSALCIHVQRDHNKEMRFTCSFCGKRMFSKNKMQIHERIHTDEKPYACDYCPSKFARRDQWKSHSEKKHGVFPPRAKMGRKRNRIVEIDQLKDAGKLVALDKTDESLDKSNGNLDKTNDTTKNRCSNTETTSRNKSKANENCVKTNDLLNKSNELLDRPEDGSEDVTIDGAD